MNLWPLSPLICPTNSVLWSSTCLPFCSTSFSGLAYFFWFFAWNYNLTQKCREALFWEKFLLYPKWVKWEFFGPKINTFELFSKSEILFEKFFWKCPWWKALKSGWKRLVWNFDKNCCGQNEEKLVIFRPKIKINWPGFSLIIPDNKHQSRTRKELLQISEGKTMLCSIWGIWLNKC